MTRLEGLQKIGLKTNGAEQVLIYSDQRLRWIKNTEGITHQKDMDNFIENVVFNPRINNKEFVAIVKDNYLAPEGVEVHKEDFIRRWKGASEVLNVQDQCLNLSLLDLLRTFLII